MSRGRGECGTNRDPRHQPGQAIVEFALVSVVFFFIVFATIDFGRVIFTYAQLHNAVREGARVAKVNENCDTSGVREAVIDKSPTLGLSAGAIGIAWSGCAPPSGTVTVSAQTPFTAVTQTFLGMSPITLRSSATVDIE